jgi:hypothetical protein
MTTSPATTRVRELAWLNKGVFIGVDGRNAGGVVYETYLVGRKVAVVTGARRASGAGLVAA